MEVLSQTKRGIRSAFDRFGIDVHRMSSRAYGEDPLLDVERLCGAWGWAVATFFDVGANVGQTAIRVRRRFSQARVLAFEPHPRTYDALRARVAGLGVETFDFAFGDAAGAGELFEYDSSDFNSLVENAPAAGRVRRTGRTVPVRVRTVDDFCAEAGIDIIDVLKVDTEGYDLHVLRGARSMLEQGRIRLVSTEFNDLFQQSSTTGGALLPIGELLYDHGFRLVATYTQKVAPEGQLFVFADALFARPPAMRGERANGGGPRRQAR